jgi:hypothetical protein
MIAGGGLPNTLHVPCPPVCKRASAAHLPARVGVHVDSVNQQIYFSLQIFCLQMSPLLSSGHPLCRGS